MKALILGAHGQLGTALQQVLGDRGVACGRDVVDITRPETIVAQLDQVQPDVVINAAAYNLVDQAEDEPEVAYAVNALGPRNLALVCAERDITLAHVSTDYVFGLNVREAPWTENDAPGPISAYGSSKLAGEYFVRSLCRQHFVIRTCGLYGHAGRSGAGKGNFVETMLRLGSQREELSIVDDQHCTPTSVKDLAQAISQLIQSEEYGLYHATNQGAATWAQFAQEIFRVAGLTTRVIPIPSSEYPTKAQRPRFSLLNCDQLKSVIGEPLPKWEDAVAEYLREREEMLQG